MQGLGGFAGQSLINGGKGCTAGVWEPNRLIVERSL